MDNLFCLILVIILGCLFSYTNGFQDGSSVAASPIASRSLTRDQAIVVTAIFEFLGAIFGGDRVASAISGITSYPRNPQFLVVLASALAAAIIWNFFTRIIKVPSSSTHALVGGLIGSIAAASGSFQYIVFGEFNYLLHPTGVAKVITALFLSPLIGFFAGYFCLHLLQFLLARATAQINVSLKRLQWLVLPALSFGHGANDSQKVMGLVVMALAASGLEGQFSLPVVGAGIPLPVRILVGFFLAAGIVGMAPGIVKNVGFGIYKQRPVHGFVSEFSSSIVVLTGSMTGGPVSASQVIASTVMGVGYAERKKGVHWLVAKDMLIAWFLTIPCAGTLGFALYQMAIAVKSL